MNDIWYKHPKWVNVNLTRIKVPHTDIELDLVVEDPHSQLLKLRDHFNKNKVTTKEAKDIQEFLKQFNIDFQYT